jgi:hypothetical protein
MTRNDYYIRLLNSVIFGGFIVTTLVGALVFMSL